MARIFITGDTHGDIDIGKLTTRRFPEQKDLTRDDIVIVCGDFGAVWDGAGHDRYVQNWWKGKPFTVCFVDGNHENFEKLDQYQVEEWNGGSIHRIADNIIHLMRGQIYTIDGKTFYTMGGAESIDKAYRQAYISWWPEEIPSYAEMAAGFNNLEAYSDKVDFIITHEGPQSVVTHMTRKINAGYTPSGYSVNEMFDAMIRSVEFKRWFFGHHHFDEIAGRFTCCYQKIYELVGDEARLVGNSIAPLAWS